MLFNGQFRDYYTGKDEILAFVLNDSEVCGRKGFAKVEIIEKLQAVVRGGILRRRLKIMMYTKKMQEKVYELA